jgi:glycosyltransferase involved in cell wall biosynthesis
MRRPAAPDERLRIAHVLPSFQIGGQERVALDLARTYQGEGHQVCAISLEGGPEGPLGAAFRAAGVEAWAVPKGPRVDPTLPFRLARRLAAEHIQVVHTHNPMALTYGAPAGKLVGAVVVHTKHGENLEQHGRRVLVRRALSVLADAFVAVSPQTAAAARASRDVREAKLRVIPNGIDLSRFGDPDGLARSGARQELGIPGEAWVVGSVGRLAPEKNHALLVRALAPRLGERARLVIVGEGPERAAIELAVRETGTARWVHLPGARSDVPRLLAAFDAFALPSISEGLPLVLLEAMAAGLPIVATSVGGIPDVVQEGVTGLLVPAADGDSLRGRLSMLQDDPALARRLGLRAREIALQRYSLRSMSDAYLELYRSLLQRR